jgi:hypothetical protein
MMRRAAGTKFSSALVTSSRAAPLLTPKRNFLGPFDIVNSLGFMVFNMGAFACLFNSFCNVYTYGLFRFKYNADDPVLVKDFKTARYCGFFVGFFFWWFVTGPAKYNRTDLEKWSLGRVGPF